MRTSPGAIDTTLVVETYNYLEGTSLESVRSALRAVVSFSPPSGCIEALLADVTSDPAIAQMLEAEFPQVRRIDAAGMGYDEAKALAAREARGRYIAYLDCDCAPEPGWFDRIMAPLREGRAEATGGLARYPGGSLSAILSLMDFGFLLPVCERPLGCYASNNSAFVLDVLLAIPEPDGPMRCRCYPHAQELQRRGHRVLLAPGASVRHQRPPFWRERLRQGYDMVAACWVDPKLPEAKLLRSRVPAAAWAFYRRRLRLDFDALRESEGVLGLSRWQRAAARPLLALLRLVDMVGIVAALTLGTRARKLVDRSPLNSSRLLEKGFSQPAPSLLSPPEGEKIME